MGWGDGSVLSLEAGDQFNVGHRRFKIVAVEVPSGVVINELGVGTFVVQATDGLKLSGEIAFQEGLRQQKAVTRLMISAPKSVKIWRGQCEFGASVALLAPVPEEHLISGQSCCEENGRVAFGSRDFEVFRNLDDQCAGAPCHVLIYPSWASQPQAGPPQATWEATYLRTVEARLDGSASPGIFRPQSTEKYPGDAKGHWAVYWEVTDIRRLEGNERIPVSLLRGWRGGKHYLKNFRPEGPLIIEAL